MRRHFDGERMKRPSFQFYPADWKNNSKLRRCSEAARGAWVDVLCLLHDSDEYGVCRWPLDELARAAGVPLKLVKELLAKDVLKGAEKNAAPYIFTPRHAGKDGDPVTLVESNGQPCWYCSRFVRDEHIRQKRGQSTQFSSDNQPPKAAPKNTPKVGIGERQGDGSTSTSSSSLKTPHTPQAGQSRAIALQTYLDQCKQNEAKPIPEGDSVFEYADSIGLSHDFLRLQWLEFKDRYTAEGAKRYKAWPVVFGKSVRGNWFKLWFAKDEGYTLSTTGIQAKKRHEGKV